MDREAYRSMSKIEAHHWWFVGRRANLSAILKTLALPEGARILEIGSGTGGNLDMLARFGYVSALEMDAEARAQAVEKTQGRYPVLAGSCPDDLPFSGEKFDLICFLDSLEHIAADEAALVAARNLLAPGGRILITVPAHPWLWSAHDIFLHHQRRYRRQGLHVLCERAGFAITRISYFNFFLFPLAVIARWKDKILKSKVATGADIPIAPVNTLFKTIFAAERFCLTRFSLPAGVSLLAILQTNDADER